MNFEITLKRMAKKHGFEYTMQDMTYGTRRAVIEVNSYSELSFVQSTLDRVNGITVKKWACNDSGVFEGYVYAWDSEEYRAYKESGEKEMASSWNWWERYNAADDETKRLMACGKLA